MSNKGQSDMADADVRAALLDIAREDAGNLLDPALYSDVHGLERLVRVAADGDIERAMGTVMRIVRHAAEHGARTIVRSWAFFRRAIDQDRP
jgi:hypothetical protein